MMNNKKYNTEDILNSLDGLQRAEAPAFFYTRLKARMEKSLEPAKQRPLVLRPVFAFAALVMIVLVNVAVILKNDNSTDTASGDTDTYQSIAAEYRLNESFTEEVYK